MISFGSSLVVTDDFTKFMRTDNESQPQKVENMAEMSKDYFEINGFNPYVS